MQKNLIPISNYPIEFQEFHKYILDLQTSKTKNVGFFVRHFGERGTEVSVYDYAHYNEEILKNKSYIVCFTPDTQKKTWPNFMDRISYQKFKDRFQIIEINDIKDMKNVIDTYNMNFFYTQTYGGYGDVYDFNNKTLWNKCKTIKHCVFDTSAPEADFYISISELLSKGRNVPVIPYIVSMPGCTQTLREELHIPSDAIVIGRHGGHGQFDVTMAHEAIKESLELIPNIYYLFMNTKPFYSHPRIIYLERNIDILYKAKFIQSCDAMIHARSGGETFGLAIGEFSSMNKPVITCKMGDLEHIKILGDKAILYDSKESLIKVFQNMNTILDSNDDWNAYKQYTPEVVMSMFKKIFDTA